MTIIQKALGVIKEAKINNKNPKVLKVNKEQMQELVEYNKKVIESGNHEFFKNLSYRVNEKGETEEYITGTLFGLLLIENDDEIITL